MYFVGQSWPSERETRLAPQYMTLRMLAPGELTAGREVKVQIAYLNRYTVQVDNNLVPQVLRPIEKKGNVYRTSEGRAKGVPRTDHLSVDREEKQELMCNLVETSYFARRSLPRFLGAEFAKCVLVLHVKWADSPRWNGRS